MTCIYYLTTDTSGAAGSDTPANPATRGFGGVIFIGRTVTVIVYIVTDLR